MNRKDFKISKDSVVKLFPKPADIAAIVGYESPIQIMLGQMRMEQENGIYKVIQEQGIAVDKDELIKALRYDRDQYDKGYVNGYNADKWISAEDRLPERNGRYLTHCLIEGQSLVCVLYYLKVGGFNESTVTHWMPLPEAPKMKGSE